MSLADKLKARKLAAASSTTNKIALEEAPKTSDNPTIKPEQVHSESIKQAETAKEAPEQRAKTPSPKNALAKLKGSIKSPVVQDSPLASPATRVRDSLATSKSEPVDSILDEPTSTTATSMVTKPVLGKKPLAARTNLMQKAKEASTGFEYNEQEVRAVEGLDADQFMQDFDELAQYIVDDVPDIGTLQARTHANLLQYPELTHILNDAQIKVIVGSFLKRKNIEIVTPSKKGAGRANMKNLTQGMTADDILDSL